MRRERQKGGRGGEGKYISSEVFNNERCGEERVRLGRMVEYSWLTIGGETLIGQLGRHVP